MRKIDALICLRNVLAIQPLGPATRAACDEALIKLAADGVNWDDFASLSDHEKATLQGIAEGQKTL